MANESVNEPCDHVEMRFSQLKQQVVDIKHNVNLLMAALSNKMGIFGDGGLNVDDKLEGGSEIEKTQRTSQIKNPEKINPI